MKVLQTTSFKRAVKSLIKMKRKFWMKQSKKIINKPEVGKKTEDLRHVWVYKYKVKVMLYLLAYSHNEEEITLLAVGSHENIYRGLKKAQ